MKQLTLFQLIALTILALCVACTGKNSDNTRVLSINDIKSDPLSFTGEITISGVASAFSENDTTFFAIMDTAELMACKNLYCGAFALPVQYTGDNPLPDLADVVDMNGSFVQTENGIYFSVREFEVKRNIMRYLTNTF